MVHPDRIRALGFEWPRLPEIEEKCVTQGNAVDLYATLERLKAGVAFYDREIAQMYEFAAKWNAPVDQVTNNRDVYGEARVNHMRAIAHLKAILHALENPAIEVPGGDRRPTMNPWIEMPGGRFVLGLLPDEVDALATASAQAARARLERDLDGGLREEREAAAKSGNLDYLCPLISRAFPPREVELAPFAIARAPVSNREWKRFLADAKLAPPDGWSVPGADGDERAVIGVSWDEANQYAAWAGGALPDEAHWERAARGSSRRLFPWGDTWGEHGAWLEEQPYYDPWTRGAHPELASPDGMHDAITRRWEWCADVFTAADVASLEELYPALRADGRVRRGGEGSALVACAVARTGTRPSWRADGTGFRLMR